MEKWSEMMCSEFGCMKVIHMLCGLTFLSLVVADDPCSSYEPLGNPKRTVSHVLTDQDDPICDVHVVQDDHWYRFEQYTGGKMPENCQDPDRCGTAVPIWMDGSHPTNDDIKDVIAYGNDGQSCKADAYNIRVKRCLEDQGEYFVYQLKEPHSCDSAYCSGEGVWCQYGTYWDEGTKTCKVRVPDVTSTSTPESVSKEESETVFTTAPPPTAASSPNLRSGSLVVSLSTLAIVVFFK